MVPRLPLKVLLCLFAIFLAGCAGISAPSGSSGGAASLPVILAAPSSQTVTTGQTATFSVAAGGTAPLSYQWRRNGTNISGATAASYTTPATSTSDNGSSFDVAVSNSKGSVTSNTATLTVSAAAVAPTVTTQPASQAAAPGASATFSVIASGTAPLSYQWQRNGTNISGATAASYTTPAATTSDNGSTFDVVVSNSQGSVTSSAATLTVSAALVAPTITTQPVSQMAAPGATATFSVIASGSAPLSYQWRRNGTNISGATAAGYTTPATSTTDNGSSFDVAVSNSKGSVTSSTATLTVSATAVPPTITTEPASQTVTAGLTATFAVVASGTAPLSYQWQKNGTNISGATAPSYTTPATTTADNGSTFDVMIRNSKGSVSSSTATLTVSATAVPPTITTEPARQTVTAGLTATFTVVASGTAPLSYQWQKNGTDISGATAPSYTTPATTIADNGSTFDIMIRNSKGSVSSSTATLTVNAAVAAPTITTQPASRTAVTAGQTATFAVLASGTAPLSYQWQKNGTNISGATSPSYTTPATTVADNGSIFDVMVSNSKGSVTSNSVTLTVIAAGLAPTITIQPASLTVVTAGQPATFAVVASGTAPLSYQWQKNGTNISGATLPSYTTPATTTADNGSIFHVMVSNSKGSVSSSTATLTVNAAVAAPTIITQPASLTVTAGQTATFTVAASGTAPLSYQWQKNGTNISGATGSAYTTPATTTSDNGSTFVAVVTNSAGSVTSNSATLRVNAAAVAPTITTQPANQTVTAGQTATFTVVASGTAPLSYQWQKNGTTISGAMGSTYSTPATTTSDNGSTFVAVVTNSAGSVTSNSATLIVNPGSQHTYSTTFPLTENPISESGNWVDGHTAGQNCPKANAGTYCWGNVRTDGTMAYGADQENVYGDAVAILTGNWNPTQSASGVVKINITPTTTDNEIALHLRMTISSQSISGYEIYCSVMPSNPYCHIARWNGPYNSFCNIESPMGPSIALVNGDTLSATISGTNPTTITGYRNGTQIMQAIDTGQNCSPGGPAGPFTSGTPGIGFFQGLNTNWNYFGFSSFQAQDK